MQDAPKGAMLNSQPGEPLNALATRDASQRFVGRAEYQDHKYGNSTILAS